MCGAVLVGLDRWILPLPTELLHRPGATFVYSQEGRLLTAFTSSDYFWRRPISLEQLSPRLISSVLTIEDRYFYQHPGVNPVSLIKAAVANFRAGRTVRGGSTITMQIARMIEPKARTIPNKLLEIFRAFQLEARFPKPELLEMYFNLAPYGGNIEGVGAAAYFYFDKEPSQLTWSEAALLTAIPGSPEKFRPDKHLDRGRQRAEIILDRLRQAEIITTAEYEAAQAEEIPSQRLSIPRTAPHLSVSLRADYPDSCQLHTTIRYEAQLACERLARAYRQKYAGKDIHNLALVVIDNDRAEIIAQVGSPDFDDTRHSGQVDASTAPRSPGSALKPFVYGLAFDMGILSPEMMVADIPVNYSGYRPVNYDETYRGVIPVREALIHSLNIPAVNAASAVQLKTFHDVLRRGGLTTLGRPYYDYGLPLVLGACEIRLTELTNLYAALAREGKYQPARNLVGADSETEVRLFSPEACYLLADILVDLKRPTLTDSWRASTAKFPVAWKTGTSYGRRDAWAIGYTPEYTVGVWAGNCSGEGSVDLVGAAISAPVMFDVFSEIVHDSHQRWYEPPVEISERMVCGVSGQPSGRFCDELITELFAVGRSPSVTCSVHRPILVNPATGMRLRASCTGGGDYERQVVEMWPPRIATWLVNNDLSDPLPSYDPECLAVDEGHAPSIISPEDGAVFEYVDELPAEYQKIRLQASIASGDGTVHWFLDGEHLVATQAGDVTFYVPRRGKHTLLCMDETGRSTRASFVVN
jgi:penicillin-binding protein 1C